MGKVKAGMRREKSCHIEGEGSEIRKVLSIHISSIREKGTGSYRRGKRDYRGI